MKRTLTLSSILLIVVAAFFAQSLAAGLVLHPVDLRCEYLKNPFGIDRTNPRLSWKLQSPPLSSRVVPVSGRGLKQTAYQIQVAATEQALADGQIDLWDSGRVNSDQSNLVTYRGKALESREMCWWKVRVWDQDGKASAWSEPALWSMGLLQPSDWDAKWIGLSGGDETRPDDP